jgi:hypothetical protein
MVGKRVTGNKGRVSVSLTNNAARFGRACFALGAVSILAACTGASELLSKDADWFARPTRIFGNDSSVSVAPLSPKKAVTPDELVSGEGTCAGMAVVESPDANVTPSATPAAAPVPVGNIGFDSTECDVVRFAGVPNSTEISANERSERAVTMTYMAGPRPGIYKFVGGRLQTIERGPTPEPPPRATKAKRRS